MCVNSVTGKCTRTFIYKDNMQGTIKTKYITSLERNADLPWTVYLKLHESQEILNNCHNIRLKKISKNSKQIFSLAFWIEVKIAVIVTKMLSYNVVNSLISKWCVHTDNGRFIVVFLRLPDKEFRTWWNEFKCNIKRWMNFSINTLKPWDWTGIRTRDPYYSSRKSQLLHSSLLK